MKCVPPYYQFLKVTFCKSLLIIPLTLCCLSLVVNHNCGDPHFYLSYHTEPHISFMNPSFYMQFNTRSREHMDIDCATILKSWFLVFSILLDVIFIWGQISSSTWCMCVDVISISWGNDSKYIDVVREYCFNTLLCLFWI